MIKRYLQIFKWVIYIGMSLILHMLVVLLIIITQKNMFSAKETKVTWITLSPASSSGSSGGSNPIADGNRVDVERQHRVDHVSYKREEVAKPKPKPNPNLKPNLLNNKLLINNQSIAKKNLSSKPIAANSILSAQPTKPVIGTAGTGSQGGVGISTGSGTFSTKNGDNIQGSGVSVANLDSNFPFAWYIQQIQSRIISNWNRINLANGRVQIYFRIKRNGSIDSIRVESPSGNASLDHMALLAVRRSDPLPRLPDGFNFDYLGVRFWFTYLK